MVGLAVARRRMPTWGGAHGLPAPEVGRRILVHAAVFGLVALLVGGGWYLRAYLHTGNPVYPFFRHTFGGAGIDDVLDPIKRPLAVTPWNVAIFFDVAIRSGSSTRGPAHAFSKNPVFAVCVTTVAPSSTKRRRPPE